MKRYGLSKATEFNHNDINIVYFKAKSGELIIEKWYMSRLYSLADYYGYDHNRSIEHSERFILDILAAVCAHDIETAQRLINEDQKRVYSLYGKKYQDTCDKTHVR